MRLGLSLSSVQLLDDYELGARNILERVAVANDAGLDSLTIGDRHATPIPYYQNVPMIARAMANWSPERPIGCLFLLPLWNPVLAAEQIATLSCLTRAPFIVQAGIGSDERQFQAMGHQISTRGPALSEAINIIQQLLAGDTVTNERFGIVGAAIRPLPPRPVDWWIAGGVTAGLERAARLGDGWYADAHITPDDAEPKIAEYRQHCGSFGRPGRAIVRKDVLILRDEKKANRIGDDLIASGFRNMSRDAVAYGSVDQVTEQLSVYKELGFDDVVIRALMVEQADALETIELAGLVRAAIKP